MYRGHASTRHLKSYHTPDLEREALYAVEDSSCRPWFRSEGNGALLYCAKKRLSSARRRVL